MKIALINNLYKPYARGGAERVAETIINELAKQKHEVAVIASKPFFGKKIVFNNKYLMLNIYFWNIISYYNLGKLPKIFRPLWHLINIFNLQSYFKVKKILKTEKPDLVMTHNLTGVGFLTPLAIGRSGVKTASAEFRRVKHIHTLHDIQLIHPSGLIFVNQENKINSVFAKIYQAINKKLFASVDVVISPSEWLINEHVKRGFFKDSKKVVMRNPIKTSPSPSLVRRGDDDGKFIFLYVGQVEKHKGIDVLLRSSAKLKEQNVLWIVGDGGESQKSKVKSQKLGLDNIKFLGQKSSIEIEELMQKADCLVVPSLCYENQPTVIIEAKQNNLPVIASDIGGIPELLEEKFLF
ncbi:MAG: glycosyltransferase, partial [Patescibacteria group bacterium]